MDGEEPTHEFDNLAPNNILYEVHGILIRVLHFPKHEHLYTFPSGSLVYYIADEHDGVECAFDSSTR